MEIDILTLTVEQAHKDLLAHKYSAVDLYRACKKNIDEKNKEINAYIEVFVDGEDMARKADEMIAAGTATTLTGIPISLKDNILYEDHIASASSKMLEHYTAVYDSTAVQLLKEAGAVIVGRTNMDEFAMGSSTESSAFGITKNPRNIARVPGGSSGGAAASVAMGGCLLALGSDTAGSVRQPAGFCGVVGFKPSYGTISRHGLMAMASSFDIIGLLGKTVSCVRAGFEVLGVPDVNDSTSVSFGDRQNGDREIKRIGVPRAFVEMEGVSDEVKTQFNQAIEKIKHAGFEIVDVELPHMPYSLAVYYILMPAEASTNLARYDGIRYGLSVSGDGVDDSYMKTREAGFGKEVQRRILLGTYVLSHGYYDAYYNKAVRIRDKITHELDEVFQYVDAVLTPTSPSPAFAFGEKQDPLQLYAADIFTVPANITGVPAVSIPNGVNSDGLPFDIQIMTPYLRDTEILSFGEVLEKILK